MIRATYYTFSGHKEFTETNRMENLMHTQYRRGHKAHGCSKLQILPYLRNYRFLWKATRSFCRYSRLLHVSTLILTSRAVVLEIRMGQTDRQTYIQTHKTTTVTLLRLLRMRQGLTRICKPCSGTLTACGSLWFRGKFFLHT